MVADRLASVGSVMGARLAPLLAVFALAGAGGAAQPQLGGCPVFPASSVWNQPVDRLPVAKDSATLIRSIGLDSLRARRLRLGALRRAEDRHPLRRRLGIDRRRRSSASVRLRRRVRPGAVPDPGERADRGRPEPRRRRPPRADRRPRHLHALRAVRAAPLAAAAGQRARARSGACARTSCGRPRGPRPTRRAADPPRASPATTRSPPERSTTRSASRRPRRGAPSSIRRGTRRATRPTRRCRRWACASG